MNLVGIDIGTQGVKAALYSAEGECRAEAFEPSRRNRPDRQIVAREVFGNIGLDGAQPRRPDAACLGDFGGLVRCPERQRDQVMNMRHRMMLHIGRRQ